MRRWHRLGGNRHGWERIFYRAIAVGKPAICHRDIGRWLWIRRIGRIRVVVLGCYGLGVTNLCQIGFAGPLPVVAKAAPAPAETYGYESDCSVKHKWVQLRG